jgi:hypothetical protein
MVDFCLIFVSLESLKRFKLSINEEIQKLNFSVGENCIKNSEKPGKTSICKDNLLK